tara:strand:- start:2210 stop:2713 length:504 start_codon:yes stop_codon:yes gene_type:complete
MEEIIFDKTSELKRTKTELEKQLKVKISIQGKKVIIKGESIDEYEARLVLDAIKFGFPTQKAILLKDQDMIFRKLHIKDFTRKKNLKEVKARIIGTKGKTLKTIEQLSYCHLILKENELGIIGSAESIDETTTAITNLIRGTKQSNIYHFLEKQNRSKKEEGLGLKK